MSNGLNLKLIGCIISIAFLSNALFAQQTERPLPIIDMHLHASTADANGPPPTGICPGKPNFPLFDSNQRWLETFVDWAMNPPCENPVWGPETDQELMEQTLEILNRRNIFGVTSGPFLNEYKQAGEDRIIPSYFFGLRDNAPTPEQVREELSTGYYKVFGEVTIQYEGKSPDHPQFAPYLEILEELDIPLGIHIGTGPPGSPHFPGFQNYRARMHSPLEIEEVAIKHPTLRIYLMHAGWPMLDDLLAVLYVYPQVYVDVGIISYALPREEFHYYIRRVVNAGFGNRIMFGSDQMNWPGAIEAAIEAIELADFLTFDQKRDILYNNAARFLRLTEEEIALHHQ
ncbi:MAG: amidohydrolase family protein [Balneolaceae bacterium]|nr:amidohydrolase family protein [Balneolaceae bacterium]